MIISLQNRFFFWTSKRPLAIHLFLASCMFARWRSQKSLRKHNALIAVNLLIIIRHMTWLSPAFIFDCGWFETGTFTLYCCDSITTLLCISEIFRHSKYDKYHWFTLYDRNNIHISLILSWQNMTLSTWLILTVCRTRVVIDLVHRRVTVAQW